MPIGPTEKTWDMVALVPPQHERVSDHEGNRCISNSQSTQESGPARLKIDYDVSNP